MQINLKNGIDKLLFGMKQNDVIALYGKPDRNYKDEDNNLILVYNAQKMRLTFYQDEGLKLGYIVASDPNLQLFGNSIIGKPITEAKNELATKGITKFTQEDFDTFENYFNEDNWFILQTEFDEVVKFEIGAIINDKDEFDFRF
ncbi:MAG TPA: hypothetical protein DCM02_00955 [Flavobacterium sp.]|nr:hypothetical protein [Flavobacterium sp.]